MGVSFGDRFIQIGNFRLGDVDGKHFSVAHAGTGKTLMVFQSDGNHGHHHCPADDFTTLGRSMEQCQAGVGGALGGQGGRVLLAASCC